MVDAFTGSYLVELSIVTAHCHDHIQDDIKNFADQLKPYLFKPLILCNIFINYIVHAVLCIVPYKFFFVRRSIVHYI